MTPAKRMKIAMRACEAIDGAGYMAASCLSVALAEKVFWFTRTEYFLFSRSVLGGRNMACEDFNEGPRGGDIPTRKANNHRILWVLMWATCPSDIRKELME